MPRLKTKMLTVKVEPQIAVEYKIAAKSKGGTMAGLLHMFIIRTINEQKEKSPDAFIRKAPAPGQKVIKARTDKPEPKKKRRRRNGDDSE